MVGEVLLDFIWYVGLPVILLLFLGLCITGWREERAYKRLCDEARARGEEVPDFYPKKTSASA
ncbi:MAG TPA: hypothetical protein VF519_16705 [Mycobacteriales bacterium]|jgi:hypothetical protein